MFYPEGRYGKRMLNFLKDLNPANVVAKYELVKYVVENIGKVKDCVIVQIVNFMGDTHGQGSFRSLVQVPSWGQYSMRLD